MRRIAFFNSLRLVLTRRYSKYFWRYPVEPRYCWRTGRQSSTSSASPILLYRGRSLILIQFPLSWRFWNCRPIITCAVSLPAAMYAQRHWRKRLAGKWSSTMPTDLPKPLSPLSPVLWALVRHWPIHMPTFWMPTIRWFPLVWPANW